MSALGDVGREAVAAQQHDVAVAARSVETMSAVDLGLGAERPRDDVAVRMVLGLLGR